jgi:hypothetical protein
MLRKTVASFLDDANVSTRKISDQLGHSKISMAQDHYLGRKLTDRQTLGRTVDGHLQAPAVSRTGDRGRAVLRATMNITHAPKQ